jgi:hypothetical protein
MADATDLKSVGSNPVGVRVPPSAPSKVLRFYDFHQLSLKHLDRW